MNNNDKVLNIVANRKQIFKTFSWTIPLKIEIVYYMMNILNRLMFETMNWDLKYLTISNNGIINSFAIRWTIIYNCITNSISKLNSLWVKQNLKKFCIWNKKWCLNYFMNKKDKVLNIVANRKQIFKTFSWAISLKLEIIYYTIETLNGLMFIIINWDFRYITISNE